MPANPRNYGDDITPQRLFQKLYENGGSYGVFSSDARTIFNRILGIGAKEGATEEAFYLNAMWGDAIGRQRVGKKEGSSDGEELYIEHPALTVCLFVQPDRYKDLVQSKVMRESGCIARICVVAAESQIGSRFETEDDLPLQKEKLRSFEEAILHIRRWKPQDPLVVGLDSEATVRRRNYFNSVEEKLGVGGSYEDVKDIASKATSIAARFALIFAVLEQAEKGELDGGVPSITGRQWVQAQELVEYFLEQAILSVRKNDIPEAESILNKIFIWLVKLSKKKDASVHGFLSCLSSEISKGIWGASKETINSLIPRCIGMGWLREGAKARNGIMRYEVNPALKQFAQLQREESGAHAMPRDATASLEELHNSLGINDLRPSRDDAMKIVGYLDRRG